MVAATKQTKKPAAKTQAVGKVSDVRAVDDNGRFILGYARHLARIRPGVDLTKPTYALGK